MIYLINKQGRQIMKSQWPQILKRSIPANGKLSLWQLMLQGVRDPCEAKKRIWGNDFVVIKNGKKIQVPFTDENIILPKGVNVGILW